MADQVTLPRLVTPGHNPKVDLPHIAQTDGRSLTLVTPKGQLNPTPLDSKVEGEAEEDNLNGPLSSVMTNI